VPAQPRLDRPLPGARRELEERFRELRPEYAGHLLRRAVGVVVLEHERVGQTRRHGGIDGRAGKLLEDPRRAVARPLAPLVQREVEVTERAAAGQGEALAVLRVPAPELLGRGLAQSRDVLGDELHLLREPPLDDGVVLVQAEGQGFAVEDLLADACGDEIVHLFGRRGAAPLRGPRHLELPEVAFRHLDPAGIARSLRPRIEHAVAHEEQEPDRQEVQK
jgi:hypothetical protein